MFAALCAVRQPGPNSSIASGGQREPLQLYERCCTAGDGCVKPPLAVSTSPSSFCHISTEVVAKKSLTEIFLRPIYSRIELPVSTPAESNKANPAEYRV